MTRGEQIGSDSSSKDPKLGRLFIAMDMLERMRADHEYRIEHPFSPSITPGTVTEAGAEHEALLERYLDRVMYGDELMINILVTKHETEQAQLAGHQRAIVTGEAHLLLDRLRDRQELRLDS